jgi:D-alanyl-lipoteichoic acid acyltransferase DltB (MBOAT superfamily)
MLFNSAIFIFIFLPLSVFCFYAIGRFNGKYARIALALLSFAFYTYWDYRFLPLFLISIGGNYTNSLLIFKQLTLGKKAEARKMLVIGIIFNLTLLGYFKYADLFVSTYNALAPSKVEWARTILPIGISFFTFTQIAYLVDVFQGKVKDFDGWDFALFVSYFPHQIAGPILHHKEMMSQFRTMEKTRWSSTLIATGLSIFAWGLFKKILVADALADLVNPIFASAEGLGSMTFIEAWCGALGYSLQLYFDFSAYCDMAIGISLLFGIRLPINFNSPYKSTNIIEFWQRWHMTLSRFLRDYLYIPLGGNRLGSARRYVNLLITMALGGLWHGGSWTFLFWGILHGTYLLINHAWREYSPGLSFAPAPDNFVWKKFCWALTFLMVMIAWVFFRAESFHGAGYLIGVMFGSHGVALPPALAGVHHYLPALAASEGWMGSVPGVNAIALLLGSLLICLCLPNAQEVFNNFQPALLERPITKKLAMLEWRPSPAWAFGLAIIAGTALSRLGNNSQFLYFNF